MKRLHKSANLLLLSFNILLLTTPVFSQNIVTSTGAPDYHFRVNGADFFPIGWFNTLTPDELSNARNNGANIVINYWYSVCDNYGPDTEFSNNDITEYVADLGLYLDTVNSLGMLAIVSLGVREDGNLGFTDAAIVNDIVIPFRNHPALFGWYIADEPYIGLQLRGHPSSARLVTLYNSVKTEDPNHPIISVIGNPEFFADYNDGLPVEDPGPFDPSSIDILGWDSYVFSDSHDNNTSPFSDFNNVSRIATARGMKQVQDHNYWGHMFVGMAHDNYQLQANDFRQMSQDDIIYESLSPIISGSRGLLYFWWRPEDSHPGTLDNVNTFMDFFTNDAGYNLDEVLLSGENKDASVQLFNFKIDGISASRSSYTWGNYNNGVFDPIDANFNEFNFIMRKHNGSYYLFVVNDFKPTIQTDFSLTLDQDESVYQIIELDPFGTETQVNFNDGNGLNGCTFPATFLAYEVKILKIDVFKWSQPKSMPAIAWETAAGGITLGDFDNNGKKDFIVMGIPDGYGGDPFRFKIGWNITKQTGSGDWFEDWSYHNFNPTGHGEMSAIAWEIGGGGVAIYDLDGNGNNEIFLMGTLNENPTGQFRFRVGWDLTGQYNSAISFDDHSYWNFPQVGHGEVAGMSSSYTGAGFEIADINSNGTPELFFTSIDNNTTPGPNEFRYKIAWDLTMGTGKLDPLNFVSVQSNYYTADAIAWDTEGADIAIGDIDEDGIFEIIFAGIEQGSYKIKYRIYNLQTNGDIEQIWRPWSDISLGTPYDIISAGVAIDDLDYDGDNDVVFMGIKDHPQGNSFYVRFGVNGRISNGNDPFLPKTVSPGLTFSETSDQSRHPKSTILVQNYPNPFNPTTKIEYTVQNDAHVKIDVYSISGQLVRTLVDKFHTNGNYIVNFDAKNLAGGIYFYRLLLNKQIMKTNKMLLIK